MMDTEGKRTPTDVSEFDREQLRFFLSGTDMARTLVELNPSLAWLPILAEMNLLQNDAALALWVEQNFASLDAVSEVVANIRFFRAESARMLEYRLNNQRDRLDPLLAKCWQLIIRHIRNEQPGALQSAWFQLLPQLKRGDLSVDVLGRVVDVLSPTLSVEGQSGWYDEVNHVTEQPSDVMSIKYGVEYGVSEGDFFAAWPETAPVATEERLIRALTGALSVVLADAIDVGVESNNGLSISDADVPSVRDHEQNAHHAGFLPIVRVAAGLWSRLINKSVSRAREVLRLWVRSEFRLVHRLALYAAADSRIAPTEAAGVLISLPRGNQYAGGGPPSGSKTLGRFSREAQTAH
jgi:hypothetical protein